MNEPANEQGILTLLEAARHDPPLHRLRYFEAFIEKLLSDYEFNLGMKTDLWSMSEGEAAENLGLSARTLQNYRVRGGGPTYIKLGLRAVRYRLRDLDEFIETHVRNNTSQHMIESG